MDAAQLPELSSITLDGGNLVLVSLLVLFLGREINSRFEYLEQHNIPMAVTGGLLCSCFTAICYFFFDLVINFDMSIRNILLLGFFSSIGLSAKLGNLLSGGKNLFILLGCAISLLVVQDIIGVTVATIFTDKPAYGLFAGSISFAGGHGTAIAWGSYMEQFGLENAGNMGIAAATMGLLVGGILGGYVSGWLIENKTTATLHSNHQRYKVATETQEEEADFTPIEAIFGTLLCLSFCIAIGHHLNVFLSQHDINLPEFLTALMVGIIVTNSVDVIKRPLNNRAINLAGEVCLHLFLVMSLMSIQLWTLLNTAGLLLLVVMLQMVAISLIAVFVVFRFSGQDYDAAVISAGFIGLGLGATPVAMANMQAITSRFGPSQKAFMIVPLVGAFFIDLSNALVIKLFGMLPLLQEGLSLP